MKNLFLNLCKFCSEEAGSIWWCEHMFWGSIFVPAVMAFMINAAIFFEGGIFYGGGSKQDFPWSNFVCEVILIFGCIMTSIFCLVKKRLVKSEEKHYLSIRFFSIISVFIFGFSFYTLGRIMATKMRVICSPINVGAELSGMIIMMTLCLILMLIGLKKNVLIQSLQMLYNTLNTSYETKPYGLYIAGIAGAICALNSLTLGFDLEQMIISFLAGIILLFGSYIMLSCILSFIYFIVQIKRPELRREGEE